MAGHDEVRDSELRLSARYAHEHPWVVQAITGFLSAYFMEHPGFRVRRHFAEPDSGMHVWLCEYPPSMTMPRLLKRLQADIPPCRVVTGDGATPAYLLDSPDAG